MGRCGGRCGDIVARAFGWLCNRYNKAGFETNTPRKFSDDQQLPLIF